MEEKEKNELSDILIKNNEKEKGSNTKNILLIAAITLLVFFIGILAFKMISGNSEQTNSEAKKQLPLPKVDNKKDELFEPVEVEAANEEAAKESLDDMIRKIKESKIKKEKEKSSVTADKNTPETKAPQKQQEKKVEKITKPKQEIIKPTKEVKKKPFKRVKKYYIQVASLSKYKPNKRFLATITNNGYKYKIIVKKINGIIVKRVYVGPFKDRKKAREALPDVMDKINDNAFIVKDY